MEQLKPCPFCGGEAYVSVHDNHYMVECGNALCEVGAYTELYYPQSYEGAVQAWNRRAERTCHIRTHSTNGSDTCESCDQCDFGWHRSINDKPFSYCPNCGAKVVDNE